MTNISDEMYENLQRILEKQNRRTYTFEETKEIGNGLIDFFALLLQLEEEENSGEDADAVAVKPK